MSIHPPSQTKIVFEQPLCIGIVASEYNTSFADSMILEAEQELRLLAPQAIIEKVRVPGSFEIPLLVKLLAERRHPDAIIALGVILRGETAHADLIAQAVSESLLQLSLTYSLPVIHEVLLLDNEEQAQARCHEEGFNRGAEAARTAIAMVKVTQNMERALSSLCDD
ncbi:MAG: 6,7-dimethyl-8-ribityllumazine synthase [Chthoniobacterales bacterium]|nr:6,7-dimethyl-8-ribityllumazine synthase [Chthoniobacterales bacterium]